MEQEKDTKTILIVEDNIGLNILLTEKIENIGYKTVAVHTGNEALYWLNAHNPFLMILDYSLPDMNGHELLAKLQQTNKSIPPFIVSTGQGDESIAVEMMKLGARDYLVKNMYFLDKLPEVLKRIDKDIENEYKRKQAEIELKNSEQKYREMADLLPVGVFETDLHCNITFVNQTVLNWLGYKADDFKNKVSITKFIIDTEHEKALLRSKRVINDKIGSSSEYLLKRKSGDIFPVIASSKPIIKDGIVTGLRATIVDITERKQAEMKLNDEQKRLRTVLETAGEPIFVKDNDHRILLANQAFCKMFKVDEINVIGKTLTELVPDNEWEHLLKVDRMVLDSGIPDQREETLTLDGFTQTIITTKTRFIDETGNKFLVGSIHDITERKKAEEETKLNSQRLKILVDILKYQSDSISEFLDYALHLAIELTNSKIGYIYNYSEAKKEFILNSWSSDVMEECEIHEKENHPELEKAGIWGEVVRQRKPIMINDYQAVHPLKKGYPKDHILLKNLLSVPIFNKNEIVAVVGVANKPNDYNNKDIDQLKLFVNVVWEIVDRKKAEKDLKNERLLLRTLIDNVPDAIYLKDTETRKTIANIADVINIGAKSESDVIGKNDFDLFPKDIAEKFYADDQIVLQTGKTILNREEFLFDQQGQILWLQSTKVPLRNQDGQIIGLIGVGHNITAQKIEESITKAYNNISDYSFQASLDQLLQKTIDEIEKLTSSTIGFIYFVDPDQVTITLQMWSTNTLLKMCSAKGKRLHHPIDKGGIWVDCVYSREPVIHNNYAEELNKKGLPDGHVPIIRELVVPIIRNEKIVAILGVGNKATDYNQADVQTVTKTANLAWEITERHQAQEALRRSEKTQKEMISNISDVIAIIGVDGMLKYKSPNIQKWFGWSPDDLIGTNAWDTVHPDDLERIQKEFFKLLEKENASSTVEYRYRCKDGNYKMIELTAINLIHDPHIEGILANYKDITDRKKVEEKMREKDLEFRKLSANVPDLIFQFTRRPDGTYYVPIASDGIKNIFGCTPNDVVDDFTPIAKVIYHEDFEKVINDIEYSAAHLTYFMCEFRVQIPDKKIQWIYSKSTPEKLPDGSITWYGFTTNITKRKLAELEILNSKESLKKAQEIAHIGNWELDLATNKIWASEEAFRIYGIKYIEHNLSLEQIQKATLPEYRPLLKKALHELISQNKPYDLEFQIKRFNNQDCLSVHSMAELVIDEKGTPIKVIGIIQDITDRKKLENELRILTNAIDQNPASIVITNTQGLIEYVNPKFNQLTGYSNSEVIGNNPRFLKTNHTSPKEYKNLWDTITKGKIWQGEFCNKKKDGSIFWESAVISPVVDSFNKITHYVAIKEDITDKKETERKIMSAFIEGEERERNRFSRELHDGLGPLLSSIKLYFQWISKIDDPEKKHFLTGKGNHNIDEAILTLREISNNLSPQSLNTFGLVAAVQNYIDGINQIKNIQISFNSNIEIRFSKNIEIALYRIILELINNCLKHANANKVFLKLHYIETTKIIRFNYKDDGKGFDLESNQKIIPGKGLLNIQYRITSLNGKTNLKTSPGEGLEVTIEVPVGNNTEKEAIE